MYVYMYACMVSVCVCTIYCFYTIIYNWLCSSFVLTKYYCQKKNIKKQAKNKLVNCDLIHFVN